MGLRTKILVTIVGPLAILLAVFVVNDLRSSRTEALDAASSALEDRVRIAATQLEGLLLRMSQVSETTSIAVRDQDEWPDEDLQQLSRSSPTIPQQLCSNFPATNKQLFGHEAGPDARSRADTWRILGSATLGSFRPLASLGSQIQKNSRLRALL